MVSPRYWCTRGEHLLTCVSSTTANPPTIEIPLHHENWGKDHRGLAPDINMLGLPRAQYDLDGVGRDSGEYRVPYLLLCTQLFTITLYRQEGPVPDWGWILAKLRGRSPADPVVAALPLTLSMAIILSYQNQLPHDRQLVAKTLFCFASSPDNCPPCFSSSR